MQKLIKIGTRKSLLAMTQSTWLAGQVATLSTPSTSSS